MISHSEIYLFSWHNIQQIRNNNNNKRWFSCCLLASNICNIWKIKYLFKCLESSLYIFVESLHWIHRLYTHTVIHFNFLAIIRNETLESLLFLLFKTLFDDIHQHVAIWTMSKVVGFHFEYTRIICRYSTVIYVD